MNVAPTAKPVAVVAPRPQTIALTDLPAQPAKLRQWLVDVATRQELYKNGRMQPLDEKTTVAILKAGLEFLVKREAAREAEQRMYLLKRFGAVLVPLDAAQPAEGDVIICERKDGERQQCVVQGGVAWTWRMGTKGLKFSNVSTLTKWRPCDLPDKPVEMETAASAVESALQKGRELAGNGAGLRVQPGAGMETVEQRKL